MNPMVAGYVKQKSPEWLAKATRLLAFLMLFFNVVLALNIVQMTKRIEVDPFVFYNQRNSLESMQMEPFTGTMSSLTEITDMYIRQYMDARFALLGNVTEQRAIWAPGGEIYRMTAPTEYYKFWREMEPILLNGNQAGVSVMVDIISVENMLSHDRPTNMWHVEFETRTVVPGSESIYIYRYFATMRIRFVKERRSTSSRLPNPLGFTVMEFSYSEKKLN